MIKVVNVVSLKVLLYRPRFRREWKNSEGNSVKYVSRRKPPREILQGLVHRSKAARLPKHRGIIEETTKKNLSSSVKSLIKSWV